MVAKDWLERRLWRPEAALALFIGALVCAFVVGAAFSDPSDTARRLLLALALLPLVNAVFDALSTGATRFFLRRGLAGRALGWAVADMAVGAFAFVALGCAAIALVQAIVALGGPALIDLAVLFGDEAAPGSILNDPHAYWWLYATFLTTLLPTALHLMLFLLSVPLTAPAPVRRAIATLLETGAGQARTNMKWGLMGLCALLSTGVVGALALLWFVPQGVAALAPAAGPMLLGLFRGFAAAIGAI